MSTASAKRHYRVAQRDKQSCENEHSLKVCRIKEVALASAIIYVSATLMGFTIGYLLGKHD